MHCYACFSKRKDPNIPRGYAQQSVVFLTKIKLYTFFKRLFEDVARQYFDSGDDNLLRVVFDTMNTVWPQPDLIPDIHEVELLGRKYQVRGA